MNKNKFREALVKDLQGSLKLVRMLVQLDEKELSKQSGIAEDKIRSIENNIIPISKTEYVAICAVIDEKCRDNEELLKAVNAVLKSSSSENIDYNGSILNQWFESFLDEDYFLEDIENWGVLDIDLLERIAKGYKIFVNYDALMNPNARKLFSRFKEILNHYNNKVIIPSVAVKKIQKIIETEDGLILDSAKEAIQIVLDMQKENIVQIRGEETDPENPDDLILDVYEIYKDRHNIAIITQNRNIFEYVEFDRGLKEAIVCEISPMGELSIFSKNYINNDYSEDDYVVDSSSTCSGPYLEDEENEIDMKLHKEEDEACIESKVDTSEDLEIDKDEIIEFGNYGDDDIEDEGIDKQGWNTL